MDWICLLSQFSTCCSSSSFWNWLLLFPRPHWRIMRTTCMSHPRLNVRRQWNCMRWPVSSWETTVWSSWWPSFCSSYRQDIRMPWSKSCWHQLLPWPTDVIQQKWALIGHNLDVDTLVAHAKAALASTGSEDGRSTTLWSVKAEVDTTTSCPPWHGPALTNTMFID